ncbi:MAG TPA: thrombospondin type 3 repeat-containing protein [Kofleriaceae bacterium]|nr:thrombospondin type 3 repeat-containing protein [Kofleriaceae bacterium]
MDSLLVAVLTAAAAAGCAAAPSEGSSRSAVQAEHRSAFAHVTDGAFTDLDGNPDNGREEWSDVPSTFFPESNSYLYADQADQRPDAGTPQSPVDTFMLMYDEVGLTTPMRPTDYFLVSFTTVELEDGVEKLEHYNIHVFADGTIMFLENGAPQAAADGATRAHEIRGQRGKVGFGPSPNSATPHVIVEFEIGLSGAAPLVHGAYSPDPQFWTSTPPRCPIPDLPEITDPQARQIEAPQTFSTMTVDGHPVSVSSRALLSDLTPKTRDGLTALLTSIVNTPGAGVPTVSSAFRPQAYQDHFIAIRDRADRLGAHVSGGAVTFTNTDPACADLRSEVARELREHGIGNNPVAHHSNHSLGIAVDVSASLPSDVSIDDLAVGTNLERPPALRIKDPPHFVDPVEESLALRIVLDGNVDILVTDAAGHRIGLDPITRGVLNEIGATASYSGAGTRPQIVEIGDGARGAYVINGIPRGSGDFTVAIDTSDGDSVALGTQLVAGSATGASPIAAIRATVADDGDITTELLPPPPPPPLPANMISNGTILMGLNPEGHLNVPGGLPSLSGTTVVGLRYLPTGAESTAPGCLCEGWGVADAISRVTGYADVSSGGVVNITRLGFVTTGTTAVSRVQIGSTFRVTHDYHPSVTPNLYEATVTIENIGTAAADVRYRRAMDWDVEPTPFSEFVTVVTVQGSDRAANVLFSSDDGFAVPNPLGTRSSILFSGDAVDSGPADHGALFDFGFGLVDPGKSVTFKIYYGAAGTEDDARRALAAVGAEVFSFGQPGTVAGRTLGTPNTFIFAFSGVGGEPVFPADGDGDGVLDELDNCPAVPNADQRDADFNGIGDACQRASQQHTTAAFLQAQPDGSTVVERRPTLAGQEPSLAEKLARIVTFRVAAGLATSATELLGHLVDSLVEAGVVAPGDAAALIAAVEALINHPPDCSAVTATPATLWPPNHAMQAIALSGATDPDGDAVTIAIAAVTQDEPVNGLGDGDTAPDAQLGPGPGQVEVRAERSGHGDGRVYRIGFVATDANGASCSGTALVGVPKSQGHGSAIDSQLVFNSLAP